MQTYFLYGFGTAWLERCALVVRGYEGGGITAWKGTNTIYANKFGVYVHDLAISAAKSLRCGAASGAMCPRPALEYVVDTGVSLRGLMKTGRFGADAHGRVWESRAWIGCCSTAEIQL